MKNMRNSRLPTLKTAGRELSRVLNRVLKPLQNDIRLSVVFFGNMLPAVVASGNKRSSRHLTFETAGSESPKLTGVLNIYSCEFAWSLGGQDSKTHLQ